MLTFHSRPARESRLSKLPLKVVFVDYRQIGTHEHIRHPKAVDELLRSILEHGYQGPPLAVFQAGSDDWFDRSQTGDTLTPQYGGLGIADGHHRLRAIATLAKQGLLRDPMIPVQLIPGRCPNLVRLATMRPGEEPLPITAIEGCFADPDIAIPRPAPLTFKHT